tara:strand:- start:1198 stop:3324 length:2127 start_codon:yes stop_codon:yes gene_type:complete
VKQVLQSLKTGETEVAEVPCPAPAHGEVLIRSSRSLISAGTERMLVDFGRAGLIGKARQQPERVKQVLDKVRTDGLAPTLETVFNKLDQPLALGYCNAGTVLETGAGVSGFSPGERVVSNGHHAEVVAVPANLCAHVPAGVSDDEAAFTVLGAIALQGIRLARPTLGEAVVVTGLGLVGLMAVQLLRAHGCRVLGVDFDAAKLRLAERFGAATVDLAAGEDPVAAAITFSRGRGADAVIIAASSKSSEPVHQAAAMSRKRGRIVLVGVTGLELSRADFYEKELSFQVSCSYGPGRYDPDYEEKGQDYPVGFVRWTAQRNFEAVLDMMADGRLDVAPLISHRFALTDAARAYDLVTGGEASLGLLLDYPGGDAVAGGLTARTVRLPAVAASGAEVSVGFIGAGNYATAVLIPAFKANDARLVSVVSKAGVSGIHAGRKFGFERTTTDVATLLSDSAIDAVVIATRHNAHGAQVLAALGAGKHVFCEKPLCLTLDELAGIEAEARARPGQLLMVGFNRRFAPHIVRMKALLDGLAEPKSFIMTVNAGTVPAGHWTQDKETGGGRIVGEACHFIDLLRHLAGAPILKHHVVSLGGTAARAITQDKATIILEFADGSTGAIHYLANGDKGFPKERLEVFCAGKVLQLDNFRTLRGWGWKGFSRLHLWRQNKGQRACVAAFLHAVEAGGAAPIPLDEIIEVSRVAIQAEDELA